MRRTGLNAKALRERTRWSKKFRRKRRKHDVPFIRQPHHYAEEHARLAESAPLYDPQPIETPEEAMIARENAYTLHRLIDTLPPREARVIRLNYGLGCEPHTFREIGKKFDVTGGRVTQIEYRALRKLKHPARSKWLENPHGARRRSRAHCNLYVPEWKREEQAAAVEAAAAAAKAARVAAEKAERAEQQRIAREFAWEEKVRQAREREARIERQLEKERQWIAAAPYREARAKEREREMARLAAEARKQWHKDEWLRQWARAESQRAAAALRETYTPPAPVYSPFHHAVFRRPGYAKVKHG